MARRFLDRKCGYGGLLLLVVALTWPACRTQPKRPPDLPVVRLEEELKVAPPEPIPTTPLPRPIPEAGRQTSSPSPRADAWVPLEPLCRQYGARLMVLARREENPTFRIETGRGRLELKVRTRIASWNGVRFWLGHGPELFDGRPFIHVLDARKNLEPLLSTSSPPLPGRTIVIDPGHGGSDHGSLNVLEHAPEKNMTLDWALRLRRQLESRGWTVHLTRSHDLRISLSDRVQVAERIRADWFVSLHFNSSHPIPTQDGIETYCLTPTGLPSTLVRYEEDDRALTLPNNRYDQQNLLLALRIQTALVRETGAEDRGVRRARFMTVLRGQQRPAVLVEGGFLSSPEEAARIGLPMYREKLATAVAEALEEVASSGW